MAKILIVEDSEIDERMLLAMVDSSHNCQTIDNGRGALDLIEQAVGQDEPYDLALIDIRLPDIGGLEVLERLRELESKVEGGLPTKAILLSGVSNAEIISKAKAIGVDGYLKKPIDARLLKSELARVGIVS